MPSIKKKFNKIQITMINNAASMAEELVSDYYKMSVNQWLCPKYDIRTLEDLLSGEISEDSFAQIIRYKGQKNGSSLESSSYDYYKICFQDHVILSLLERSPEINFFSFILYIITHELIHIVRFGKFLQSFDASSEDRLTEEVRVHELTRKILSGVNLPGLRDVLEFYEQYGSFFDKTI